MAPVQPHKGAIPDHPLNDAGAITRMASSVEIISKSSPALKSAVRSKKPSSSWHRIVGSSWSPNGYDLTFFLRSFDSMQRTGN
jgi:hypothetical protein